MRHWRRRSPHDRRPRRRTPPASSDFPERRGRRRSRSGSCSGDSPGPGVLPASLLERLGCRQHPETLAFVPPSEPTIRRTLQAANADDLAQAVGQWFLDQKLLPDGAISVDGKTLRGSRTPSDKAVHLLSAFVGAVRATIARSASPTRPTRSPRSSRFSSLSISPATSSWPTPSIPRPRRPAGLWKTRGRIMS